jgi:sigma-B regulation protein RsbU (phosphoserine phosphatase)
MKPQASEDRLQRLRAVTDAALGRLSVEDLLVTLLDRALELVDADTATVLLVDVGGHTLVARASRGVEEEVRQGVRVPIGAGFAGRVALERRPVMIDRVDPTTVRNQILWERGIRVMLGVPLLVAAEVIGVLHVGRLEDLPFDAADAELLSVAGERMAAAIQTEQRHSAEAAASMLEESLRPSRLPECPGLDLAARYLPAGRRGVGGDWYDVFKLPTGELWIVVGDVAGHGLPAAVVMSRAQSTLRAFATLGGPPEEALERTDRAVQIFDSRAMITVVCATTESPYRELRMATAGHPPPVIAAPGRPPELTKLTVGPPLGVGEAVRRSSDLVRLPLGGSALFYTDGLIERKGESLDAGFARLCACLRANERADDACRRVLRHLIGDTESGDDVAVVVVHRDNGG